MKVRYKGEIRTSMATLDEEGLLGLENKNFASSVGDEGTLIEI